MQNNNNMTTVKEILAANRDSVISAIKFNFKVYGANDIKVKMIEFLAYCEENLNIEKFETLTAKKTFLGQLVRCMYNKQQKANNLRMYGTEKPKLADLVAYGHEDETYSVLDKSWIKN